MLRDLRFSPRFPGLREREFLPMSLAGRGARTLAESIHRSSVLCGAMEVSPVQLGGPGRDARLSTRKLYALPEASRIESFTETSASSTASTVQIAAASTPPLNMGGNADGKGMEKCAVVASFPDCTRAKMPATKTSPNTKPPTTRPAIALFQGNGIGGGAAASRRTASMTETAKPDDGSISSSCERMRFISSSSCPTSSCPLKRLTPTPAD